jgi:hypothetical protein
MGHVFPQGLKPNAYADFYGTDKSVPFQDICPFQEIRDRSRDPRPFKRSETFHDNDAASIFIDLFSRMTSPVS